MNVPGVPEVRVEQLGAPYVPDLHGKWYVFGNVQGSYLYPDLVWRKNCWDRFGKHGYYPSKEDAVLAAQMWWDKEQEKAPA